MLGGVVGGALGDATTPTGEEQLTTALLPCASGAVRVRRRIGHEDLLLFQAPVG